MNTSILPGRSAPCVALATILVLSSAEAADIGVPGDAPTIQAAIEIAADGDRILVSPGVWPGQIDFEGKAIELVATDGPDVTILDGELETGFVVTIAAVGGKGAGLRGFSIRGGVGSAGSDGLGPGGGVRVEDATAVLENLVVTDNSGIDGGGISGSGADLTVRGSRLAGNVAQFGGGLSASASTLLLEDSVIEGNHATNGGGASFTAGSTVVLRNVQVLDNGVAQLGGGLYVAGGSLDGAEVDLVGNGLATEQPGSIVFDTLAGGGLYTNHVEGRLDRLRLTDNRAAFGGGIYVAGGGTLELINALVARNLAGTGAVYCNASSPRLLNLTLVDNPTLIGLFTTFNAEPLVENSILSNPTAATGGNGAITVRFSVVDGGLFSATSGEGVVEGDAMLDSEADYAPLPGSPAIDAGDGLALPDDVTLDLLGNVRAVDDPATPDGGNGPAPVVDIGAIEFGSSAPGSALNADMNVDGTVDMADLVMLLADFGSCEGCASDLDGDGTVGVADLLMLLAEWGPVTG